MTCPRRPVVRTATAMAALIAAATLATTAPAQRSGRVEAGQANCVALLTADYGASDTTVSRTSTRNSDKIFIHVDAALPSGETREFRCQLRRVGSDVLHVRVFEPGVDENNGWVSADPLKIENAAPAQPAPAEAGAAVADPVPSGPKTLSVEDGHGDRFKPAK
ncbi:MAG: hypothetical protein AAFR52_12745 [Pseudomonadota bacterium]